MTVSKNLFLSILAMDAYNRGYGAGISDGEGAKDDGGNDLDGLGGLDSSVGAARVIAQDVSDAAQTASFYAIAYEVDVSQITGWDGPDATDTNTGTNTGKKTVISYRGTDDLNPFSLTYPFVDLNIDPVTGWLVGTGGAGTQFPRCGDRQHARPDMIWIKDKGASAPQVLR